MSSSLPATLGKYQIIREIARSNDIVYEGYDPVMNRRVAIKELAMPSGASSSQQEERLSRFKREARAAGTLAHPNIMTVYEFGEDEGRYFIAMEFLDGHTLRNEIDTKGFLPPDEAVDIALQALAGLEYAHSKGVIHRDIKPDNIQLLSDDRVKLTDFGIARLTFEPNITMDGQVFGTPSYMSPEQVVGREIDARSDLFSMGVVLYEMIAGKKPFLGDSVVATTYAVMNHEPDQPAQCNYALWQVLIKAMDKSPALRFSSAAEMMEALKNAQHSVGDDMVIDPRTMAGAPMYPGGMAQVPGGSVMPPPILYPFNPYTGPGPQGHPMPMPGPGVAANMGQAPIPIYYPPPPRQPLLKPETRHTLGRVFMATLVLGTLIAVILVAVTQLSRAIQSMRTHSHDQEVAARLDKTDANMPLDERISTEEKLRQTLNDPGTIAAENGRLASLYEQRGKRELGDQDKASAEQDFIKATEMDPQNGAYYSDLGALYAEVAQAERDPSQGLSMWQLSTKSWKQAADLVQNPEQRDKYGEGVAISGYEAALGLQEIGDAVEARQQLYVARDYAPANSPVSKRIQGLLDQLDGDSTDSQP